MADSSRLSAARVMLAMKYPYLAVATLRLPFRELPEHHACKTMATDGYHIWYRSEWVAQLDDEAMIGVIAHEVLHVVFGHADRRMDRNPEIWNIAADHAINLLLSQQSQKIPVGGCCDFVFRNLAAEEIYDRLTTGSKALSSSAAIRMAESSGAIDLLKSNDPIVAGIGDSDAPDQEGRRQLRHELVNAMKSEFHGHMPGSLVEELDRSTSSHLDWGKIFSRFLFEQVRSDWSMYPFSRKHLHRGLYLPSASIHSVGHVVFAIDTSGSMSTKDLAIAFSEVRRLREMFPSRLTVIQCDASIQEVSEYGEWDGADVPERIVVKGRGGTDFKPVFVWLREHGEGPIAPILVFVTDGIGSFPKVAYEGPCFWLVTKNGARSSAFPFGIVIRRSA